MNEAQPDLFKDESGPHRITLSGPALTRALRLGVEGRVRIFSMERSRKSNAVFHLTYAGKELTAEEIGIQ